MGRGAVYRYQGGDKSWFYVGNLTYEVLCGLLQFRRIPTMKETHEH